MKAANINEQVTGFIIAFILGVSLLGTPNQGKAQDSSYPAPTEKYSREELAQMMAPIALYPDALLSQVLMASTYPIEVIEADRWVKKNPGLKDDALDSALMDKDWDPSVKAMCYFPSILALMSDRIAETTTIGNAFLAQEDEVLDMIQELRAKAYAQGNLTSTPDQKIVVEKETIIIEPVNPRIYYVPYYDPFYIYGPWWYPAYPPYYWWPPGVRVGIGISYWPAFYFGFSFGSWSYFDWHRHYIYVDVHRRPRYVRHDHWVVSPGPWRHAPRHRRGVAYRDKSTAVKYGQYPYRTRKYRHETRGFPEQRERVQRIEKRPRVERQKSEQQQKVRSTEIQERTRAEQQERIRTQPEREMQERTRVEQQERIRIETGRQEIQRVQRDRQVQQKAVQETRKREWDVREQQHKSRESVFNRVEDGRREIQSSQRGQASRQTMSGDSRGRGRTDADNKGGRSQGQRPR